MTEYDKTDGCDDCDNCFSTHEKNELTKIGWTTEQIDYAEHSIIEDKIKEIIKK